MKFAQKTRQKSGEYLLGGLLLYGKNKSTLLNNFGAHLKWRFEIRKSRDNFLKGMMSIQKCKRNVF